jgi:hypothetical protein
VVALVQRALILQGDVGDIWPGRQERVYGVTTSSSLLSITVYDTLDTVGSALSVARKDEPTSCCTHASQVVLSTLLTGTSKPSVLPRTVRPSSVVP